MTRTNMTVIAAIIVAVVLSFWAGSELRQAQIDDLCLEGTSKNCSNFGAAV